ncbi:MAG: hypothetical protein J6Y82_10200 [Bacteroidales bacterium]|nr:hypothetical protein [Bacteroidales bacterium]
MNLSELLDNRDGQVYRLLFYDCRPLLQHILANYNINDSQREYDCIMDFYLYLRGDEEPFAMLTAIKSEKALPSWLKTVFSRFMARRANHDGQTDYSDSAFDKIPDDEEDSRIFTISDLNTAITLIEQINTSYSAPERVIFFADIDALASNRHSTDEIISVLHCTEGNLRVMRHRLKKRVQQTLAKLTTND